MQELSYMLQRLMPQHQGKRGADNICQLGCCHPREPAWAEQVLVSSSQGFVPAAEGTRQHSAKGRGGRSSSKQPVSVPGNASLPQGGITQQPMSVSQVLTQLFMSKIWLFARLCAWVDRAEGQRLAGLAVAGPSNAQLPGLQQLALQLAQQLAADPAKARLAELPQGSLLISPHRSVQAAAVQMYYKLTQREMQQQKGFEYQGLQEQVRD